ncbi:MAG TPA: hypothetical protein VF049_22290 [Nocardioidaceae bacterium]
MTQPSPADELRAAAFQLRNPFHHPGLTVGIDTDVAHALADLLDEIATEVTAAEGTEYELLAHDPDTSWTAALAVARAINGDPR